MSKTRTQFLCSTLIFVILLSTNTLRASEENAIHINITDIDWPPYFSYYEDYDYTRYDIAISFQIWNPGENKTIATPSGCLFMFYMIIDLDGFYLEKHDRGGICTCMVTTHTIDSGLTNRSSFVDFIISDYNNSVPPYGEITLWVEFDDSSNSYTVFSYTAKVIYNTTGIYYEFQEIDDFKSTNTLNSNVKAIYLILSLGLILLIKKKRKLVS